MLGSERYMTPHNVRFNTYDPAVDNILQQLKSCNKLAAFVRDSIIYYLGSKQGRQAADLMCRKKPTNRPACTTTLRIEAKQGTDGVLELSRPTISSHGNKYSQLMPVVADSGIASQQSVSLVAGASQRSIIEKIFCTDTIF
jgi:hypothetical protein